jgi:multiple sugar transport system substrate-binding protein
MIALSASACSSGGSSGTTSNGKTVITFANWADAEQNTHPGIDAAIKEYESLHPNVTIKSEPISYTDIDHQLLLEIRSGNPPDVAEVQGDYTYDQAATGDLQPLSSLMSSQWKAQIIPNELQLGMISGQQDAIPWTVGPYALWYNKTLMTKAGLSPTPPSTWSQVLTDAKAIHAKEPKVITFGIDSTAREYALDQDWPIIKSFGGVPFAGTKATANTPAVQNFLSFMRTMAKDGYTPEGQKAGYFRQPAASNQVAFTVDGPYVKGVAQAANHMSDQQFYSTWGVAALPTGSAGTHYSTPTDHQLVMYKNAPDKKAAWDFMSWLATSQWAVLNYSIKYENSIPPLAHATGVVAAKLNNPIAQSFLTGIIPTVIKPAWGAHYSSVYLDFTSAVQQAMTTSTPISSVASSLQSKLTTDLAG